MTDQPLRVPISTAARKGVSWLADTATERRVILTRFDAPHAVVDSAERLDADVQLLRQAAETVISAYADRARGRVTFMNLDEVCARLGVDAEEVRTHAAQMRAVDAAR